MLWPCVNIFVDLDEGIVTIGFTEPAGMDTLLWPVRKDICVTFQLDLSLLSSPKLASKLQKTKGG